MARSRTSSWLCSNGTVIVVAGWLPHSARYCVSGDSSWLCGGPWRRSSRVTVRVLAIGSNPLEVGAGHVLPAGGQVRPVADDAPELPQDPRALGADGGDRGPAEDEPGVGVEGRQPPLLVPQHLED